MILLVKFLAKIRNACRNNSVIASSMIIITNSNRLNMTAPSNDNMHTDNPHNSTENCFIFQ